MALYHDMQQLIGNTPLVKLSHLDLPDGANLYAKLELYRITLICLTERIFMQN